MMVELQLPPDLERQLHAEASKLGLTLEDHLVSMIEKHVISLGLPALVQPRRQPRIAKDPIHGSDD
jgi:hypothetical protein